MTLLKHFVYGLSFVAITLFMGACMNEKNKMAAKLETSLLILPVTDLEKTSDYYSNTIGFRAVKYLKTEQPHICLYRDAVEIILIKSKLPKIQPNRELHGYGYDGYFTGKNIKPIYEELVSKNVKIVKPLAMTDYGNFEFVLEDIDGRWICFGVKQEWNRMDKDNK